MRLAPRQPFPRSAIAALLSLFGGCQQAPPASAPAVATYDITSSFASKFESGAVRPLALSADRHWLYATNTSDGRLEVLRPSHGGLKRISSVTVGLEPVAVAVRSHSTEV